MAQCYYRRGFNLCVLTGELTLGECELLCQAVEVLRAACDALFLSPQQICLLDFCPSDLTPISLPVALFWLFSQTLFQLFNSGYQR